MSNSQDFSRTPDFSKLISLYVGSNRQFSDSEIEIITEGRITARAIRAWRYGENRPSDCSLFILARVLPPSFAEKLGHLVGCKIIPMDADEVPLSANALLEQLGKVAIQLAAHASIKPLNHQHVDTFNDILRGAH